MSWTKTVLQLSNLSTVIECVCTCVSADPVDPTLISGIHMKDKRLMDQYMLDSECECLSWCWCLLRTFVFWTISSQTVIWAPDLRWNWHVNCTLHVEVGLLFGLLSVFKQVSCVFPDEHTGPSSESYCLQHIEAEFMSRVSSFRMQWNDIGLMDIQLTSLQPQCVFHHVNIVFNLFSRELKVFLKEYYDVTPDSRTRP